MATSREIKDKLWALYEELFLHDGYGELQLEMRTLKRGQKEVIVRCGKQYRYIVNFPCGSAKTADAAGDGRTAERRRGDSPYDGPDRRRASRRAGNPAAEECPKSHG